MTQETISTAAQTRTRKRLGSASKKIIIAAFGVMTLAGCKHLESIEKNHAPHLIDANYRERHHIDVVKKTARIRLNIRPNADGLTTSQLSKVHRFMAAYNKTVQSPLTIEAPSGASNESSTIAALKEVRNVTKQYGVPVAALDLRPYFAEGEIAPPIRMSFERNVAVGPDCPDWSQNMAKDRENVPFSNYGCATQKNLAAIIANPRDLIEPRGHDPLSRPSDRRDTVFRDYIRGETTSARRSEEEKSAISDVSKE